MRVVAVHQEALLTVPGHLHPARVARLAVDVARDALLDQVVHPLAVAVDEAAREVVLDRLPQVRIAVLRELPQAQP
jgi:hypothetical protein